ncbi:hypothetical protein [Novosphingobium album (ex Hu et al. 2023)]|uniref:Uncharacterized protein n=1 Tax=Novosphingobium album (ex Hu et al. 2023) TaxID=2930093 RepID=A0ABT0AXA9_9SPHN|nr:hypothetical protein [Novosphingobium album (ex Hu et al. 2023)]MCJ2177194.1 hypothetical protein [Novosphingobium album (ex Hu et al. 2023)]
MPIHIRDSGDSAGEGHELKLAYFDDGNVILHSHNPDTGEGQRIVIMEDQWRSLLRSLLDVYGKEKCCFYNGKGLCLDECPDEPPAPARQ